MPDSPHDAIYDTAPLCMFYSKTPVPGNPTTFRYEALDVRGGPYGESGGLVTPYPPHVGDLIHLNAGEDHQGGTYRIIEVARGYPSYRSQVWRINDRWPRRGPMISIILVPEVGPFRNEADNVDDEMS